MRKIRFKKMRLWLMYPFFIFYPLVAHMSDISFLSGVVLMVMGLAIRFWASGYLTKSRALTTSGPYAYTRNPLYLGNFILGLGISTMASNLLLNIYYMVSFSVLYLGTIKEEQSVLEEKFGEPYRKYIKGVPMFFPSLIPYKASEKKPFDLRQSFRNGEFIRICGFSMLIIFFYLWRIYTLKSEGIDSDYRVAISLFVVFSFLLWFNISIRRRKETEWTGKNA